MSINSKNFGALLSPLIDEWHEETYNDGEAYPECYPSIYNVDTTDKMTYLVEPIIPAGLFTEQDPDGGHTEYEDPALGSPTLFTQHKYSKGMRITEAIWRFNKTSKLRDLTQDMARSARWTIEYNSVLPILHGWGSGDGTQVGTAAFSGTTQTYTYNDGYSFFHSAHTIDGTPAKVGELYDLKNTWSNTVSSALAQTTLASACTALRKQPNGIGIPDIMRRPDTLFVGPDNEIVARQLLANTSDNSSGLNSGVVNPIGVFNIKLKVVPYFLDTGIWALRAPLKQTYGKFLWNERPGQPMKETDFDSDVLKVRSKMWFTLGFSDARGWVGGGQS